MLILQCAYFHRRYIEKEELELKFENKKLSLKTLVERFEFKEETSHFYCEQHASVLLEKLIKWTVHLYSCDSGFKTVLDNTFRLFVVQRDQVWMPEFNAVLGLS